MLDLEVVLPHQAQPVILFVFTIPLGGKHFILMIKDGFFIPVAMNTFLPLAQRPPQEIEYQLS